MPRSSKAPDPPPEPDVNEIMQNDVAKIKRLLGLDVNRLALGSEVEGLITTPSGTNDYTIIGPHVIEFVNVSTNLGPSQGGSGFPAQVTGLTVTPHAGSNTQLDLAWTAITAPDFNYYNVYRGITSGFVVDGSSEIAQPVTNSYNNTGLTAGTTYYYRVSVTNDAELEGTPSSQVSGTTTGFAPMLELHLDGNFTDTSPNNHTVLGNNGNGFLTPGQFGTAWKCNYPLVPPSILGYDVLYLNDHPTLRLNTTVGFSFSIWVYPVTFGVARKWLMLKCDDVNNEFVVMIEPSTLVVQFHVKKAGTSYKRQTTGLTVNAWNHIAGTFNGSTNVIEVYKNAVAGAASTASTSYQSSSTATEFKIGDIIGGPGTIDNKIQGYLDEIRYYQGVVLTPTQITNLMNTNAT